MQVLIDPGHGGSNLGAMDGAENKLNLDTAFILEDLLTFSGISCRMTRSGEEDVSLSKRASMAINCDLAISIHYNWSSNPSNHGAHIFYRRRDNEADTISRLVAGGFSHSKVDAVVRGDELYPSAYNVLGRYKVPAILVECLFLSNKRDLARLKKPLTKSIIAMGIARGVLERFNDQ